MRNFFSGNKKCSIGCKYCFSNCLSSVSLFPLFSSKLVQDNDAIVYPCCDGEFLEQDGIIAAIRLLTQKAGKVYVSISTKGSIDDSSLDALAELQSELLEKKKGFIKIAISASNKSQINQLEPNAISYSDRLLLADRISKSGVFLGLTIKPILPFISAGEYIEIIDDFLPFTNKILIGGLYVNKESEFFEQYHISQYNLQKRLVNWLPTPIFWDYVEDTEQIEFIQEYSNKKGISLFNSDVDLINSLAEDYKING